MDDNDPVHEGASSFSEADQLLLLQLLTRQDVVKRQEQSADSGGEAEEDSDQVDGGVRMPEHWRLLPEEIGLYDWQQECLGLWMKERRGTVKVATGGGKTLFGLAVAERLHCGQIAPYAWFPEPVWWKEPNEEEAHRDGHDQTS